MHLILSSSILGQPRSKPIPGTMLRFCWWVTNVTWRMSGSCHQSGADSWPSTLVRRIPTLPFPEPLMADSTDCQEPILLLFLIVRFCSHLHCCSHFSALSRSRTMKMMAVWDPPHYRLHPRLTDRNYYNVLLFYWTKPCPAR